MNKNLSQQTAMVTPDVLERQEPTQEELLLAIRFKKLCEMPEWQALTQSMKPELQRLQDSAFNSSKPQPVRINAMEQITGMRIVLEYPANYAAAVDEMLKPLGRTLDDYMVKLKEVKQ